MLKKKGIKSAWTDPLILFLLISFTFIFLEKVHSYYFLSDDNRTFYLPLFIHNVRAISAGEIPFFNWHQYLGIPHFSNFQSAIFYPLPYLSIWFSKLFSGHEFWAIDIAVFFHFFIGSLGFYRLIKHFTKDRASSVFGGIIWPLASFSVFISNSWWIFSGVVAWFPWILLFAFRLLAKPTTKNLTLLILFRLLLFYVGHIEYFIHCLIFEFLTLLLFGSSLFPQKTTKKFLTKYILSYPFTLVYTLPILLPGWFRMRSSGVRNSNFDFATLHANALNLKDWLHGLFTPFKLDPDFYFRSNFKFSFGSFPHLSHLGYITILLVIFCAVNVLRNRKFRKFSIAKIVYFLLFLITLLWSFGLLAGLLYYLPILNRFRFPFKLLAFTNYYLVFAACFGFHFLAKMISKIHLKRFLQVGLIFLTLLNFFILYSRVYVSLNYHDHFDKIPLQESYSQQFQDGRIFSRGVSDVDPFSVRTLGYNYPLLLGLQQFAGYDPLMPQKNFDACLNIKYRACYEGLDLPLDYLRRWSVKWYILNKNTFPESHFFEFKKILENDSLKVFADEPQRLIFHDKKAFPFVYWRRTNSTENIDFEIKTNSLFIKTNSSENQDLIINWLANDSFRAFLNGNKIPIDETEIGQMKLNLPAGKNRIVIKYVNRYFTIGVIAVLIVSLGLVIWMRMRKANK